MLIEAVVDKGQLRLLKSVQLAHDQVHVMVDIPDNEILGYELHPVETEVLSSSSLIKQLWSVRTHAETYEAGLLEDIEKKYE